VCVKNKIIKLLNLTTSSNDNEALSAIKKANKILNNLNMSWNDVLYNEGQKNTFNDLSDDQIYDFLIKKMKSNHFKDRIAARMIMKLSRRSTKIKQMEKFWSC